MKKPVYLRVAYEPDKEKVTISREHINEPVKFYNRIRTPNDIGVAVKDYVIELEGKEEIQC